MQGLLPGVRQAPGRAASEAGTAACTLTARPQLPCRVAAWEPCRGACLRPSLLPLATWKSMNAKGKFLSLLPLLGGAEQAWWGPSGEGALPSPGFPAPWGGDCQALVGGPHWESSGALDKPLTN